MKTFIALLALAMPMIATAQSFIETFDSNSRGWTQAGDKDCSRSITDGKYILKTFKEGSGEYTALPSFMDPLKDFTMQATFVQRDGSINNGIGFYWSRNGKKYNDFVFTTNGYYKFGEFGKSEWVKTELVKPLNEENTLRLERREGTLSYYLNETLLGSNQLSNFGFEGGFINYTNMTLEIDNFQFAQENKIRLADNLPSGLVKENLGSAVNSSAFEVSPNISTDGRSLYFVRKKHEENTGGKEDASDIWVSDLANAQWSPARKIGEPVNTTGVDNLTAVSADNNTVYMIRSGKFVFYRRTVDGWTAMMDLGPSYTTESQYMESQLSADGKVLLATLQTPSNVSYQKDVDEKDLYVSVQDKDGSWSSFTNLGLTINTLGDETSPFLSPDGRTLYFATTGRPGYGGHDIYLSKRIGNGWTNWSEPLNLGPDINTPQFDAYYTVPASGDHAYMVSDKNSMGETDIVRMTLPQSVKPNPVVLIIGKTINAKTKQPVAAEILLDDLSTGKEVAEAMSNPRSGEFRIVLPSGANYGLHGAAKGFLSVNENLELASIKQYAEVEKNLLLIPIEVGVSLQLNNVFFEQGKPVLRAESYPELDRLVQILKDNQGIHIEVSGYTDNVGPAAALLKLSQDRVTSVINYLNSKEVGKHRLTGKGFGSASPIVRNDTEGHRKMNRRVEFKITKK